MTLQKIPVRDLRVGMFLVRFDGAWLDHAGWRQRYRLASDQHLAVAISSGAQWCWIDPTLGSCADPAPVAAEASAMAGEAPAVTAGPRRAAAKPASLMEEMRLANRLRKQARATVTAVFADARLGKAPDIEATRPVVAAIVDSVLRRKGAMLCLAHLKFKDDYTYMHSMSVCALAAAVAHDLGMDLARCRSVGLAALLHDVGKSRVPLEVLNKPGKLTAAEWSLVRLHPRLGCELLKDSGFTDADGLDSCLHHHEKQDGTGYPQRLTGEAISLVARIVAACDVFDAMTTARPYKPAWDPALAIKEMAGWRGHFDRHVLAAFIRVVGIYPVGSLVSLASGRLAVVVDNPNADPRAPTVRAFYSTRSHEPLPLQLIDLSAGSTRDSIVGLEPRDRWNFPQLDALCDLPC
jgi:putative nucleotidyltransferase with HDIG domain